jgi:hypothetical protein
VLKRSTFDNTCSVVETRARGGGGQWQHEASFAVFGNTVEISFAHILRSTTLVWRAMRLANIGSEQRMREPIRDGHDEGS